MKKYDAIVIGSGAGGGVAACALAEAGKTVLLLERGGKLSFADIGRDHLRNQRFSQYGVNAGPNIYGNPRVMTNETGRREIVNPLHWGYQNNAACVGSGTVVYGAQAWRFMPQDFRMASIYGIPEGSSLADWPISHEELAPSYERAEWEMGVCGNSAAMPHLPAYRKPYPMPPMALNLRGTTLGRGAGALGWETVRIPLLINSVPYNNRPACAHCQQCIGFACPADAKNGTQNTMIPRGLATGRMELITEAMAGKIETNASGRVTGVTYFDASGEAVTVQSEIVVVSAGAVETARLLLNSATSAEPAGLGNGSDQVGRHLQGHYYAGATALFPETVWDMDGPGPTTATCKFNHGNEGIIGGGMLSDEFIILPIIFWKQMLPPDLPRWGQANKDFMRENYRRVMGIRGPVQEIPHPGSRVTVDSEVRDRWGLPVARFSGTTHPETVRTTAFMSDRAREWLTASGAVKIWGGAPSLSLSAGQHQSGTCRMGNDPNTSVVNEWCRVHGHDNLFIADTSPHVTNGGFNPVLTALALAFRTAENIVKNW